MRRRQGGRKARADFAPIELHVGGGRFVAPEALARTAAEQHLDRSSTWSSLGVTHSHL